MRIIIKEKDWITCLWSPRSISCLHLPLSSASSSLTPTNLMSSPNRLGLALPPEHLTRCSSHVLIPDPLHPVGDQGELQHLRLCLLSPPRCDSLSKPNCITCLTTNFYIFPFIPGHPFFSSITPGAFFHPFQPACTHLFTSFPQSPLLDR